MLAEVRKLEARGMTRAEIARALRISQRYVRRLTNQRPDDSQMSLFD